MRPVGRRARGTFWKEAFEISAAGPVSIGVLLLAGCITLGCSRPKDSASRTEAPAKDATERSVITESAEATRYSVKGARRKLWTVRWRSSNLTFTSDGKFGGSMDVVEGTLYQDDKPASTFKATRGLADKDTGELKLEGKVEVTSIQHKAVLRSERIVWPSKDKEIVQAIGRVWLDSQGYRTGEFPELWATPDLSKLGTPDTFADRQ